MGGCIETVCRNLGILCIMNVLAIHDMYDATEIVTNNVSGNGTTRILT